MTAGAGSLQVIKADSSISNLYSAAQLVVNAEGRGALADMVGLVNGSPLGEITSHALVQASASGPADFRFKLALPLANPERATVQGGLTLPGNDVQIRPDTPRLSRARGAIAFSDTGFSVTGVQARALGGEVRIEGGLNTKSPAQVMRIQGSATAEGLGEAHELGLVARLAKYGSGATPYSATLGLRAGVAELQVNTNLAGMALNLPEPFRKTAQALLPLRLETSALRPEATGASKPALQDQLLLELGTLASVRYVRDVSGAEARVLRGAIGVGLSADESAVLPERGVAANIQVGVLDVDAWTQVLSQTSDVPAGTSASTASAQSLTLTYLPDSLVVRAQTLALGGAQIQPGAGRWRTRRAAVARQRGCHRAQWLSGIPTVARSPGRAPLRASGTSFGGAQRRAGDGEHSGRAARQHPGDGHCGGGLRTARQKARAGRYRSGQPGRHRRQGCEPRVAAQPL
jgi:uncharacterized protein YhdP